MIHAIRFGERLLGITERLAPRRDEAPTEAAPSSGDAAERDPVPAPPRRGRTLGLLGLGAGALVVLGVLLLLVVVIGGVAVWWSMAGA